MRPEQLLNVGACFEFLEAALRMGVQVMADFDEFRRDFNMFNHLVRIPWFLFSLKRLSPLLSALQQVLRYGIGDALHHLNKHNHNDYRRPSHSLVEFLVSVGNGEIT